MFRDPGAVTRPEPLAYFLTWTTYGSWLPGDDRGWVDRRGVVHGRKPALRTDARERLVMPSVSLALDQRRTVVQCVAAHAAHRGWRLHAVECRSQHVHVVVSASERQARQVIAEFKAWCSRSLSSFSTGRTLGRPRRWWTKGGSVRNVYDERALVNVVTYVNECQDRPRV